MDVQEKQEREVIYLPAKEDSATSALNILFGIMMGVLLIFVIYLASLAMLGNWNPTLPTQLNIETTPVPAPSPPAPVQPKSDLTVPLATPAPAIPANSQPATVNQESSQTTTTTTSSP